MCAAGVVVGAVVVVVVVVVAVVVVAMGRGVAGTMCAAGVVVVVVLVVVAVVNRGGGQRRGGPMCAHVARCMVVGVGVVDVVAKEAAGRGGRADVRGMSRRHSSESRSDSCFAAVAEAVAVDAVACTASRRSVVMILDRPGARSKRLIVGR